MNEKCQSKVEYIIQSHIQNNATAEVNVFQLFNSIFKSVNDEKVGGIWRLFKISNSNTELLRTYASSQENVRYAPEWLVKQCEYNIAHNMRIESPEILGGSVTGGNIIGGEFFNSNKTTKLIMGMDGNLGDMKVIRDADDTVVFQVYDDITNTTLKRDGVGFIQTSGKTTYPLHTWDFKDAEVKNLTSTAVFG